nr:MAG TPA: hypothetical protein [Bacteriophage sp.]
MAENYPPDSKVFFAASTATTFYNTSFPCYCSTGKRGRQHTQEVKGWRRKRAERGRQRCSM